MFEWVYLLRQRRDDEQRFQAALHGAKLKERGSFGGDAKPSSIAELAGKMGGGKLPVQRVKVSDEEMARRRAAAEKGTSP